MMLERCPKCGAAAIPFIRHELPVRENTGIICHDRCGWEITISGLERELAQAQEQLQQALAREARLRRVVEVARNLAVTLHRHNEQTVLRHRLGDDADLADDEGYCCEICCEVGDLLYDLGQALGEIGIDDLSKIPDLRDLAKLDPERRAEAIRRLNEGEALEDVLVSIRGQGGGGE